MWSIAISFFVCALLLHFAVSMLMEIWQVLLIIAVLVLVIVIYIRFRKNRPKY